MTALRRAPGPCNVLRGHEGDVQCLEFLSPCLLASGDIHGIVKLWNTDQLRPVMSMRLHDPLAGILSLQKISSSNKEILISAGRDGVIKAWQLGESGCLSSAPILEIESGTFSFCRPFSRHCPTLHGPPKNESLEGSRHISQGPNHLSEAEVHDASCHHQRPVERTSVSGSYYLIACAGLNSGEVRLWDIRAGAGSCLLLKSPNEATKMGMCMALHILEGDNPESCEVLGGFEDGSLVGWDVRYAMQPVAMHQGHSDPIMCLTVSQFERGVNGRVRRQVCTGAADDKICCWRLESGQARGELLSNPSLSGRHDQDDQSSASFSLIDPPQGAATGTDCGVGSLRLIKQLTLNEPGISDLAFESKGRIFASAGWDGKVRLFSGEKKSPLAILRYHQKEVTCVRFMPSPINDVQGINIMSASRDHTIALWSVYNT